MMVGIKYKKKKKKKKRYCRRAQFLHDNDTISAWCDIVRLWVNEWKNGKLRKINRYIELQIEGSMIFMSKGMWSKMR